MSLRIGQAEVGFAPRPHSLGGVVPWRQRTDTGPELVRVYLCGRCGQAVDFAASRCSRCGGELGFWAEGDEFVVLDDRVSGTGDAQYVRCLNAAWGCNWILGAGDGEIWCRSCRLTRGRPDTARPEAIAAWEIAEGFKRRLVRQLMTLGLPVDPPKRPVGDDPNLQPGDEPDGIVFDLVYLPDNPGMTGHRPGAITLDLREIDDSYREQVRASLGEAERTVLGHLRHEIGHHYWRVLVEAPGDHAAFRALFGDERTDYEAALGWHYRRQIGLAPETHITYYATSHPAEDWAETFAHYLAVRDGIETVDSYSNRSAAGVEDIEPAPGRGWVERWRAISDTVNAVAVGLGHRAPYPYPITEPVSAKLSYVHERVEDAQRPDVRGQYR